MIRLIIAFWNGYFGPSFGAEVDAAEFHLKALVYAEKLPDEFIIGWVYSIFLAGVYQLITPSLFLGSVLSCLAWLLSALLLHSCFCLIEADHRKYFSAFIIYAMLPSSIIYTSVTLREAYQLLFLNIALFSILKINRDNSKKYWIVLLFSILAAGSLHGALLAFGVALICMAFILKTVFNSISEKKQKLSLAKLLIGVMLIIFSASIGLVLLHEFAYNLNDGFILAINNYNAGAISIDARANYRTDIESISLFGFFYFVITAFWQFMFEPLPWNMSSFSDVFVFIENILRFFLLSKAWKIRKTLKNYDFYIWIVIFIAICLLEAIWSIGTVNWGTAIRHHLPGIGFLLVAAYFSNSNSKKPNHLIKL